MIRFRQSLSVKNVVGRPTRSIGLIVLAMLLSLTMLSGALIVSSLVRGLDSLDERLGADIMVVPYEATTKSGLEDIVLQGNMGYFYMNSAYMDKLADVEGVGKMSAQFYLVSTSASCCSVPVEIVGFDPDTDFTISPWVKKSHGKKLGDLDVVVGNDLNVFVGDKLRFYDVDVNVAAKLDKTGTGLDTAVYTNKNTIRKLIKASLDKKMNTFTDIDPDHVVSCVMINAADGYTPEEVANNINIHTRGIEAVQTKNMISGVSESLAGISGVIAVMIVIIWILSLGVLTAAFVISFSERKKEFAILRAMGASIKKVSHIALSEGVIISLIGSVIGVIISVVIIPAFSSLIEKQLALPFLLPSVWTILVTALASLILSTAAGSLACVLAAKKISRIDTGLILREG